VDFIEQGITRKHTFFCVDRERHTRAATKVIEITPKQIVVFGREVRGWVVTTEEPIEEETIPLRESLQGAKFRQDPE